MGKKKGSKRLGLRKKFKIKRRIGQHQKKVRKLAKKIAKRKRLKKDPGIPNLWPEKLRMIQQLQRQRVNQRLNEDKMRLEKQNRRNMNKMKGLSEQQAMFKLRLQAHQKTRDFESKEMYKIEELEQNQAGQNVQTMRNQTSRFYKDFKTVLGQSDVLILVLDARDPLGCRSMAIEKQIMSSGVGKKLIFLLNKIDLVPQEVVQKWLVYLRKEHPTFPFKSNTQKQKSRLGSAHFSGSDSNEAPAHLRFGGKCLGKEYLIKVLKRIAGQKTITVGIVGYPNVGKSSVINSLRGKKVAEVGSKPGMTTKTQVFKHDRNLHFIDSPGIIFPSRGSGGIDTDIILRNAIQVEKLDDTVLPVDLIRRRCSNERLMKLYKIPYFQTTEEFLTKLAYKTGKLLKGGKPNIQLTGRMVLKDWNEGKIPFFTLPPNEDKDGDVIMDGDNRVGGGGSGGMDMMSSMEERKVSWDVVDDNSVLKKIKGFTDRGMENLIPMLSSLKL